MLGLLLNDLHITYQIDKNALCDGLCSPAMLKKYMLGKKKPEKLLGDALWQRAGKSMEKFEVFLEQDESVLAACRARIQLLMRRGRLNDAEDAIQNYKTLPGADHPLHHQFLCLQYAEIDRRRQAPYQKQLINLRDGIHQTISARIISPEILDTRLLGMLELLLLERYAFLIEKERPKEAARWYEALLRCLTRTGPDDRPRDLADTCRLLPPVYYHQAKLLAASGQDKAALRALNEGIRILGERQGFEGLFIRMAELRIKLQQKSEVKYKEEENDGLLSLNSEIACLRLLREEMEEYGAENLENIYPDYPERSIFCVNQIFRERRLARGISEEDMADRIGCDVRTLRDAEAGKRMPQTATKNKFFQEFGLSTWKYCGSISTRTYSFFRESATMIDYLYSKEQEKAEEIYKRITKALNKNELINQNFIKYWNIRLQENKENFSNAEYRNTLLKMLMETLPNQNEASSQCILTEYEREIFRSLAWTMNRNDPEGIKDMLRVQYQKFHENDFLACLFPEYYMAITYCLARFERLQQHFREAENILEDALKQIHFLQDDWRLENLCMQYFQLEEAKRKSAGLSSEQKNDSRFCWVRRAYAVSKLYLQDSVSIKYIENYLKRHYGEDNGILNGLF